MPGTHPHPHSSATPLSRTPRRHPGHFRPAAWLPLLLAVPAPALGAALEVEAGPLVLGRAASAVVILRLDGGRHDGGRLDMDRKVEEDPARSDAPLRLAASAGAFGPAERIGPGAYRATYTPPTTRFPQLVLVAAWPGGTPDPRVELLRLPLHGTARLAVKAPAGRKVSVEVGGKRFGPARAGRGGEAVVSIVVPPLVREAHVTVVGGARPVVRAVALEIPPVRRLLAVAVPAEVVADGRTPVRLEVFREGDPGEPEMAAARIRVAASEGEVVLARAGAGAFTFRYLPAPGPDREVRFDVTVDGEEGARSEAKLAVRAAATTAVGPPAPSQTPDAATASPALPEPSPARDLASGGAERGQESTPATGVHLGLRLGWVDSLGEVAGSRFGLDAWVPLRFGPVALGAELSVSRGTTGAVTGADGALASGWAAQIYPLTVRMAYEPWSRGRMALAGGLGWSVVLARFAGPAGARQGAVGTGVLVFAAARYAVGPGHVFGEASLGAAPVSTPGLRVETAGLGLDAGYRFALP